MAIRRYFSTATTSKPAQTIPRSQNSTSELRSKVQEHGEYIDTVKKAIDAGSLKILGDPIVKPSCPFALATELNHMRKHAGEDCLKKGDFVQLVKRPEIFAWVPDKIFSDINIKCPTCKNIISSGCWTCPRMLHGIARQTIYITKTYICYNCHDDKQAQTLTNIGFNVKSRKRKRFQADDVEVLYSFPDYVRSVWNFVNSGRILCEAGVVDFIRALATRTSWSGIAEAINELKSTAWDRDVVTKVSSLCNYFDTPNIGEDVAFPDEYSLNAKSVRNIYVADADRRREAVRCELSAEVGDDVLVLDWTSDAAARCRGDFLFNAMDGHRRILMSSLTTSSSPRETEPLLRSLKRRGVSPKVVYVDTECCGAWRLIIGKLWPEAFIKLDGMHAMRRLIRTTTTTQHPWHGQFCAALSNAIYTYDAQTMIRLAAARRRDGLRGNVPNHAKSKYVSRVIVDAESIAQRIDEIIKSFNVPHPTAGPLLTAATLEAWRELRSHVLSGCICDPPNIEMNLFGDEVKIGGEAFRTVRTLRGASALEGFHNHQKQWLGCLARHAADAGSALLADGAVRWNRKRHRSSDVDQACTEDSE